MTYLITPRTRTTARAATGVLLLALAGAAQAHTGRGTTSFAQGLAHPLGLDHLLAMVAVGIWSVSALPARQAWQGPAMFLAAMVAGAVLGLSGASVPFLEYLIAGSVVLCGVLLASAHLKLPHGVALACVATSAAMHGLAHGRAPIPAFRSVCRWLCADHISASPERRGGGLVPEAPVCPAGHPLPDVGGCGVRCLWRLPVDTGLTVPHHHAKPRGQPFRSLVNAAGVGRVCGPVGGLCQCARRIAATAGQHTAHRTHIPGV